MTCFYHFEFLETSARPKVKSVYSVIGVMNFSHQLNTNSRNLFPSRFQDISSYKHTFSYFEIILFRISNYFRYARFLSALKTLRELSCFSWKSFFYNFYENYKRRAILIKKNNLLLV